MQKIREYLPDGSKMPNFDSFGTPIKIGDEYYLFELDGGHTDVVDRFNLGRYVAEVIIDLSQEDLEEILSVADVPFEKEEY